MADQNKPNPRQKYTVLVPYQCPNLKHWHEKDDEVELLPCEADFLRLSGKIKIVAVKNVPVAANKQKGEGNA